MLLWKADVFKIKGCCAARLRKVEREAHPVGEDIAELLSPS